MNSAIKTSIQKNINNINLIVLLPESSNGIEAGILANNLGIRETYDKDNEKIIIIPETEINDELKKYSDSHIAGVYTGKSKFFKRNNKHSDIQYFLNRPLYHPYDAKFTIVQTKGDMKKIDFPNKPIGENDLNNLLVNFICNINNNRMNGA